MPWIHPVLEGVHVRPVAFVSHLCGQVRERRAGRNPVGLGGDALGGEVYMRCAARKWV